MTNKMKWWDLRGWMRATKVLPASIINIQIYVKVWHNEVHTCSLSLSVIIEKDYNYNHHRFPIKEYKKCA